MIRTLLFICLLLLAACGPSAKKEEEDTTSKASPLVAAPSINQDSAYYFVDTQVKFGPRIPSSVAHKKTGDYLNATLRKYGANVTEQTFESMSYDGKKHSLRNIIGSYFPTKQKRILLAAHWDTRPFADRDKETPNVEFDGANDGASGVGVLLEIARVLNKSTEPNVGIDIIFFDGEDYGEKMGEDGPAYPEGLEFWWCLGSQYWATHKHKANYSAYFGICLDMVGARNSKFFKEGASLNYAPSIVDKVWSVASRLGYSGIFINQKAAPITDDHIPVNNKANIPMIDIVHYDPVIGYFGDYHHSTKDNMSNIDKEILGIVAQVVVQVIYSEQ